MTAKSGLLMEDVYQELHLRGYNYGPTFQGVLECNSEGENTFCRRKIEHDYCVVRNICFFLIQFVLIIHLTMLRGVTMFLV